MRQPRRDDIEQLVDRGAVAHVGHNRHHLLPATAGGVQRHPGLASASRPRATSTTLPPPASKRSAIARPIPLVPPVTTAHWPSSGRSSSDIAGLLLLLALRLVEAAPLLDVGVDELRRQHLDVLRAYVLDLRVRAADASSTDAPLRASASWPGSVTM